MKVVLYTIGCPKCKVIEKKLKLKGIAFEICTDVNEMRKLGISTAPKLQVDSGPLMDFNAANKWINQQEAKNGNT